jgi:MFS transporter, DHA2 family, multidrug resistance protein
LFELGGAAVILACAIALVMALTVARKRPLIMGFSDTFAVIGVVLAVAAVAILFTRKVQAGGAAAAH